MRQVRTYALRVDAQDVKARSLLEARAGQVPFLHGYNIDMSFVTMDGLDTANDIISASVFLQANPQAPTTPFAINTDPWLALVNHQGNIAVMGRQVENLSIIAGGGEAQFKMVDFNFSTGYTPLEFEVPGLWVVAQGGDVGATASRAVITVTLHFDWVNRSAMEVAALYTTYGIDPVDFAEREATAAGQIRFGQTVAGENPKPTLIS